MYICVQRCKWASRVITTQWEVLVIAAAARNKILIEPGNNGVNGVLMVRLPGEKETFAKLPAKIKNHLQLFCGACQ